MKKILTIWFATLLVLLVLRPVSGPEFWWHLCRGREVFAGHLNPSQELLVLESVADADWLGGVPFFFLWSVAGPLGIAFFPLIFLCLSYPRFRRWIEAPDHWRMIVCFTLLIFAIRSSLEPTPLFFDCCLLVLAGSIFLRRWSDLQKVISLLLLFMVWGNVAQFPIWGLVWLVASISTIDHSDGRIATGWKLLAAAVLGGCLTPRGVFTWHDSFMLSAAPVFVPPDSYGSERWASLLFHDFGIREVAAAVLWGYATSLMVVQQVRGTQPGNRTFISRRTALGFEAFAMLCVSIVSRSNVPLTAIWSFHRVSTILSPPISIPVSRGLAPKSVHRRSTTTVCMLIGLSAIAVVDSFGILAPESGRLGWGIASQNDVRLLDQPFRSDEASDVIAWAADARSAGMILWTNPNSRVIDHPDRALLDGRISEHNALLADLKMDRRAAYRTETGTWSGWVRRLDGWKVDLIVTPVETLRLNESIARSTWKLLDLDAPVMLFGRAEDPRLAARILETISQQGFVEAGPWDPSSDIYDGRGWRYDVIELFGGGMDPAAAIRQSTLFRAIDLPLASLRALRPVRQQTRSSAMANEFQRCQEHVAYQEWSTFGAASEFRRRLLKVIAPLSEDADQEWRRPEPKDDADWTIPIDHYLEGNVEFAANAISGSSDEQRFAAAMLWVECGDTAKALKIIESVLDHEAPPSTSVAAHYWKQQLEQYVKP